MTKSLSRYAGLIFVILFFLTPKSFSDDLNLNLFGYFQSEFHQESDSGIQSNTFLLQQLNLFFQKELADDWTSFVNVEIINSYSSSRDWGSLNLEEAWVSYRASDQFKFKLGLHIPEFNNLNTIKNRTPLLPYIIRPFAYETSFGEFFGLDFVTPQRAYVSLYGAVPSHRWKFDYAAYIGNSPNIRTGAQVRQIQRNSAPQSGTDTTVHVMVGGRIGARHTSGLKLGVSGTYEEFRMDENAPLNIYALPTGQTVDRPLYRIGSDLSYYWKSIGLESEYIKSKIEKMGPTEIDVSVDFYYITLGYYLTDNLFLYGTWSSMDIHDFDTKPVITPPADTNYVTYWSKIRVNLPYIGCSYNLNSRITFKGQVMLATVDTKDYELRYLTEVDRNKRDINRFALAVSAFF